MTDNVYYVKSSSPLRFNCLRLLSDPLDAMQKEPGAHSRAAAQPIGWSDYLTRRTSSAETGLAALPQDCRMNVATAAISSPLSAWP